MEKSLHDYLLSVDVKGEWEHPPDQQRDVAFKNIYTLKKELEVLIDITLDIDKDVQDASFITDVGLLDERCFDRETGTGIVTYLFSFRFSNFGDMFTAYGEVFDTNPEQYKLHEAINHIVEKGYKYIPASGLSLKYDGVNEPYIPNLTWWTRYFDYL